MPDRSTHRQAGRSVRRAQPLQLGVRPDGRAVAADHQGRTPELRLAFYQAANVARRRDPELAACYRRLMVERGHNHMKANCAIARKLVTRVWTTLTRGRPIPVALQMLFGLNELAIHHDDIATAAGRRYRPDTDVLEVLKPMWERALGGLPGTDDVWTDILTASGRTPA